MLPKFSPRDSIFDSLSAFNRAVYIHENDANLLQLTHNGALKYLQSIAGDTEKSDFMVVDVLLQEPALRAISTALLSSTVWYDVTNGDTYVSHSDDGLGVFESVKTLTQVRDIDLSNIFMMMIFIIVCSIAATWPCVVDTFPQDACCSLLYCRYEPTALEQWF